MLPNTYDGKTAEELFPAFKPNAVSNEIKDSNKLSFCFFVQILQFNKIFGIGKTHHLPKPWANLRKRSVKEVNFE